MDRVPVEIWTIILSNLHDSQDILNAAKAWQPWRHILHSSRNMWLFREVLPLILDHLTKKDVLVCQQVCQQWCQGVDHFLENNAYHRPPSGLVNHRREAYLDDFAVREMLQNKELKYHGGTASVAGKRKFIDHAAAARGDHAARNPIVGRAIILRERILTDNVVRLHHTRFLHYFGHHIWSLDLFINIDNQYSEPCKPVDYFKRIVELLSFTPNLKKLAFKLELSRMWDMFMEKLAENWVTGLSRSQLKLGVPKTLEALELRTTSASINNFLFRLLANGNLKSLKVHTTEMVSSLALAPNLLDIRFQAKLPLFSNPFLKLRCPLKKINIKLVDHGCIARLFPLLNHFGATLESLLLNLHWDYNAHLGAPGLDSLLNRHMLKGCTRLKSVKFCVHGHAPLDFLCSVADSLEYLDINYHVLSRPPRDSVKLRTDLDLISDMKICYYCCDPMRIYESKVWTIFPKLRELTAQYHSNVHQFAFEEQKFRRLN